MTVARRSTGLIRLVLWDRARHKEEVDANTIRREPIVAGWALVGASAVLVGAKAIDLFVVRFDEERPWIDGVVRLLLLVVLLAGTTLVVLGKKRRRTIFVLSGLWPMNLHPGKWFEGERRVRVALGFLAVVCPGLGLVFASRGSRVLAIILAITGALLMVALVIQEVVRVRRHRGDPRSPQPDRVILWTVAPPSIALIGGCVGGVIARTSSPGSESGVGWEFWELVFVTAFGEELLFRGFLLGLGLLATRQGRAGVGKDRTRQAFWAVSLAFGVWHLPDALLDADAANYSGGAGAILVAGTVLFTMLASRYVLIPLRLRTGTIVAPALVHFAANAPGVLFDWSTPFQEPPMTPV